MEKIMAWGTAMARDGMIAPIVKSQDANENAETGAPRCGEHRTIVIIIVG